MKDHLRELVIQALLDLRRAGQLPPDGEPEFAIERARSREHGDYASNVALLLAKAAGRNPRELANQILASLPASQHIAKVEIAGPGFINFHLAPAAYEREVARVLELGEAYGRNTSGGGVRVGVEYVSANPTGPLHVGHGRAGAIGDSIARVLEANGWDVVREETYRRQLELGIFPDGTPLPRRNHDRRGRNPCAHTKEIPCRNPSRTRCRSSSTATTPNGARPAGSQRTSRPVARSTWADRAPPIPISRTLPPLVLTSSRAAPPLATYQVFEPTWTTEDLIAAALNDAKAKADAADADHDCVAPQPRPLRGVHLPQLLELPVSQDRLVHREHARVAGVERIGRVTFLALKRFGRHSKPLSSRKPPPCRL